MPGGAIYLLVDWPRGLVHIVNQNGIRVYTTAKETQVAPLRSVPLTGVSIYAQPGLDQETGDILIVGSFPDHPRANNMPVFRVNTETGEVGNWDGVASNLGSYPSGYWVPESVIGLVCNAVSYAVVKEDAFSGQVAVARMTTPCDHAGHEHAIVSNNLNNRAALAVGAAGISGASAFLVDANNPGVTSFKVYYVHIAPGAETYNPLSWPTTNPYITSGTLATVNMADVNPAFTQITGAGIGYDHSDGNVIVFCNDARSNPQNVVKVNAADGTVMWSTVVNCHASTQNLQHSRIKDGKLWLLHDNLNGSTILDTEIGAATVTPLTGITASTGRPTIYDGADMAVFQGSFNAISGTGNTNPAEAAPGTISFTNGFGLIWPKADPTEPPVDPPPAAALALDDVSISTYATRVAGSQIFLEWSDDRGHTFGNPVGQPIGARGAYLTSVSWNRLGYGRDRVFRLTFSVPVQTAIQGAWIEADTSAKS